VTGGERTDATTSLQHLKDMVRAFCEVRDWDRFHNPKDLAIGIVTEAGELLEHFRFKSPAEIEAALNDPAARTGIADEIADVLYFVLRLAQKYGIDLSTEFHRKMRLNEARYPAAAARGRNTKYTDL